MSLLNASASRPSACSRALAALLPARVARRMRARFSAASGDRRSACRTAELDVAADLAALRHQALVRYHAHLEPFRCPETFQAHRMTRTDNSAPHSDL